MEHDAPARQGPGLGIGPGRRGDDGGSGSSV
jgi:hypothetical protein